MKQEKVEQRQIGTVMHVFIIAALTPRCRLNCAAIAANGTIAHYEIGLPHTEILFCIAFLSLPYP